jgi:hypothetical protein
MSLLDNSRTDKNTVHSYLELYEKLLRPIKYKSLNVLEVGIFEGGSIKMWNDFFPNASVHGVDIIHINNVWEPIRNNEKIILHTSTDAYDSNFVKKSFLDSNIRFDFILDDGSHQLEDMKKFIKLYSEIMTEDGILIIEDVQDLNWLQILKDETPEDLKAYIKTYDLRENKNRYDDIVFTIDKSS